MNIKKLKIQPKLISLILAGAFSTTLLTSCEKQSNFKVDKNYSYPQAIIFDDNRATIVTIESWNNFYNNNNKLYQLNVENGPIFTASIYQTILYSEEQSGITAEEFIKTLKGDDIEINYLGEEKQKTK